MSILNAITSGAGGVALTGDTTGNLTIQSAGTNVATITATGANAGIQLASFAAPAFSAYLNSAQSVSSSTFTKIQLNAKEYDTASAFDATTNYRFTPQVAEYYQFNTQVTTYSTATNIVPAIYKNGTQYIRTLNYATTNTESVTASWMVYLNGSTDYVELWINLSTGQGLNYGSASTEKTALQGFLARCA